MRIRHVRWEWQVVVYAISASLVVWAVLLVWARGEVDSARVLMPVGPTVLLELDADEERSIFMTADMSEGMNFDFSPSDFSCSMVGPTGEPLDSWVHRDSRRLLDGWRSHREVMSFTAEHPGVHQLRCSDRASRELCLVVAGRLRWKAPVRPVLGAFFLISSILGGLLLISVVSLSRYAPRSDSKL